MDEKISASSLKNIKILYEGDLCELAQLLLKVEDAKDKGKNTKSRYTVKGIINKYALLTNMDHQQIMAHIAGHNLPLGAIVEHDEDVR